MKYRIFFVEASTPPSTQWKLTEYGKCCMQNNQHSTISLLRSLPLHLQPFNKYVCSKHIYYYKVGDADGNRHKEVMMSQGTILSPQTKFSILQLYCINICRDTAASSRFDCSSVESSKGLERTYSQWPESKSFSVKLTISYLIDLWESYDHKLRCKLLVTFSPMQDMPTIHRWFVFILMHATSSCTLYWRTYLYHIQQAQSLLAICQIAVDDK